MMRPAGYCVNNGRVNRRVGPWRLGPNSGYSFTATINDTNVLCITLCLRRTWLCGVHVVRNSPYNVTVKTTLTSAKVSWLPAHVEGGRYHHLVWYVHVVSVSITKSSRCNARHAPATSVCMSNCTCVCVCVSVRRHISTTRRPNFAKFSTHVRRRRFDVFVLPVLWMTSRVQITARNRRRRKAVNTK